MKTGTDTVPIEEIIRRTGLSKATVYEGFRRGNLPAIQVCDRWVCPRHAFELLMSLGQQGMDRAIDPPAIDVDELVLRIRRELLEIDRRRIEVALNETDEYRIITETQRTRRVRR